MQQLCHPPTMISSYIFSCSHKEILVNQKYHIEIIITIRNISKYEKKLWLWKLCYRTYCHSDLVTGIIHSCSSWEWVLAKIMILAIDFEDVKTYHGHLNTPLGCWKQFHSSDQHKNKEGFVVYFKSNCPIK